MQLEYQLDDTYSLILSLYFLYQVESPSTLLFQVQPSPDFATAHPVSSYIFSLHEVESMQEERSAS